MSTFQDAFISYGRADSKAFATKLYNCLLEQGLAIWFDQNDIPLGVDFQNQIDDGLEKSHNFLFIIAPHSVNSPYCGKEIELALKRNKRIIPLLHVEQITQATWQQRNPDSSLADWETYKAKGLHSSFPNMHPAIGKINWVYFREGIDDFEKSFAGLLEIFQRCGDYVQQHTHLLAKALEWEHHQKQSRYLLTGNERIAAETWLRVQFEHEQPPCEPTDLHCEFICESIKNANNLMTQLFLSYATEDRAFMQKLARTMMREGITVWTNKTDIQTGDDYIEMLNRGIEEANNIVFLMSPASLQSEFCQQELAYAQSFNKRIIPLLIQAVEPEKIPANLRSLQFINIPADQDEAKYRADAAKVIRSLHQDAAYYEQRKTLLVKALKWERQKRNPSILLRGYSLRQAESWLKGSRARSQHPPTTLHEAFIAESLKQLPDQDLDVFISYSQADADFARKLNEGLQLQGFKTWFDQESIAPGADFQQEIHRGIERSNNFLFVISPNSVISPYCADEVEHAAKLNKRAVPILFREVETKDLHPILASLQWINFQKHGGDFFLNFGDLVRTLATNPEHVRSHTRLLLKAIEWEQENRDDSFLLRGKDLLASEQWLQQATGKEPAPTHQQLQYLTTSRELPRRRVKRRTVLLSGVIATALVSVARFFGVTQPLELWSYDRLITLRPSEAQDNRILLIKVDEPTLEMLPKRYEPSWGTLPDQALNDLFQILNRAQPQVVGIDFIRDYAAKPELASTLKQMQNLVGLCQATGSEQNLQQQGIKPPPEVPLERIGFSNFLNDGGKFLRRHLLLQAPDEEHCDTLDAFSVQIARRYLEAKGHTYKSPLDDQGDIKHEMQFGTMAVFPLGGIDKNALPLLGAVGQTTLRHLESGSGYRDREGELEGYQTLLNFRTHQGRLDQFAQTVSLKDVLENRVAPETIRDRIVIIGLTAETSTKADYWKTPYGEIPGVVLQAQMVSQLVSATLDGRPLIWWLPLWAETVWILGWSLVGGAIVWGVYRFNRMAIAGVGSLVILSGVCYILLAGWAGWLPLAPAAIALLMAGGIVAGFTYRLRNP